MSWPEAVLGTYLSVLGLLSLNGVHRLWMLGVWWRAKEPPRPAPLAALPRVTVQLPLFDERYVAERVIRATAALRYPRDLLQIQVLDDSTDDTTAICARVVEELAGEGHDIVLVHRDDRTGFKAGALENGLRTATGELIAVFDADFVPEPGFLGDLVPWFADPEVGMVQARWGHLNARDSWLTHAQATLLDGHFVIEHTARNRAGRWFNFNGTAGIWRRAAIVDAGGWQHDTLTEDLDLSYRAQLAGWRFVYLPEVVAPAELPFDLAGFKSQQHRWAKGSVQTAKKLLGPIWRSGAPLANKVEATTHLCANLTYPLVIVLAALLPWAVAARMQEGARVEALIQVDLVLFLFAVLPFVAFYGAAVWGSGAGGVGGRLARLPVALAVGLGMAASQSRAVAEGLWGSVGTFARTPKRGGAHRVVYLAATRGLVGLELLLGLYLSLACVYAVSQGYWASLPFLLLFAGGFGGLGLASVLPGRSAAKIAIAGGQVTHHSQGDSAQAPVAGSNASSTR
jgi:cellulose synthase/poly-beta-1,6-N-acetylglucosamine synthase-like glycosyltransferase